MTNSTMEPRVTCEDLPPSNFDWLRRAAASVVTAPTWRASLALLAYLLVHVADVLLFMRYGWTTVLQPSRTGGVDHSLRATMAGLSPMCRLGGGFTDGAECDRPNRRIPEVREVLTRAGWVVVRRWRLVRAQVRLTGVVACFDPVLATRGADGRES